MRAAALVLVLLSVLLGMSFIFDQAPMHESGFERNVPIQLVLFGVGCVVLAGLTVTSGVGEGLLSVDAALGRLSYPLYLMHAPVLFAASRLGLERGQPAFLGALLFSVVLALLCWIFFERRFDDKQTRIRGPDLKSYAGADVVKRSSMAGAP